MTEATTEATRPTRLPDWQTRLECLCADRMAAPFVWGQQDCCLWAADAVQALTGQDPAAHLRGQYDTAEGAARLLRELGGVRAVATTALGPAVPVLRAAVGDVVLIHNAGRDLLGVCIGTAVLAPGPAGLGAVPLMSAQAAWKV